MSLIVAPVPVGKRLLDTTAPFTEAFLDEIVAGHHDGIIGYLNGNLTAQAIASATGRGLGVIPVNFSRGEGWIPTPALGKQDAARSIEALTALAVPVRGLYDWCDVEGCGANPTGYADAWCAELEGDNAGRLPGEYLGGGALLGGHAHYLLPFLGYWRSLSNVPEPDCGFMMDQFYPTATVGGIPVDYNLTHHDYKNRAPTWLIAA